MPPEFNVDQQRFLKSRQRGQAWPWPALRPPMVCGVALGNPTTNAARTRRSTSPTATCSGAAGCGRDWRAGSTWTWRVPMSLETTMADKGPLWDSMRAKVPVDLRRPAQAKDHPVTVSLKA